MKVIADLHLHSKYSRAVSPQMVIPEMVRWAKIKGINLLGTGDFTHPLWFRELQTNLEEEDGVLKIKSGEIEGIKGDGGFEVRFLLTAEISSIYSQGGKTRKIHNLVVAPSFLVADKINQELKNRGCNLLSDGRPIIGLSAKDLLNLVLSVDEKCLFIPCHIWTPWFSLYGANSGFDSMSECFGDLAKYIFTVETGLSSDPYMNWQVEDLDNRQIVSFSDAHSPAKMGREATVLEIKDKKIFKYEDIRRAIVGEGGGGEGFGGGEERITYTIEFYPEEGKYHYTGHRNCGVVQSPEETAKKGATCPVCGKGLTVGVMERVRRVGKLGKVGEEGKTDEFEVTWITEKKEQEDKREKKKRPAFIKLVPLAEIIAESFAVGLASKRVAEEYDRLIKIFGNELKILMKLKLDEIAKVGGKKLAEGIMKVRRGDIFIRPGYDGEYGKVNVWENPAFAKATAGKKGEEGEMGEKGEQNTLF